MQQNIQKSSKLLIDESPLIVIPSLAVKLGLNEAIILQQVHYWLKITNQTKGSTKSDYASHCIDGRVWMYKTVKEWQIQFPFFSTSTINRTISNLEKIGVLLSGEYNKMNTDRTKWYTIDYAKLDDEKVKKTAKSSKHHPKEDIEKPSKTAVSQVGKVNETALSQVDQVELVNLGSRVSQDDQLLPKTPVPKSTLPKKTTTAARINVVVPILNNIDVDKHVTKLPAGITVKLPVGITTELPTGITKKLVDKLIGIHGPDVVRTHLENMSDKMSVIDDPPAWLTAAASRKYEYVGKKGVNLLAIQENKELTDKVMARLNEESSAPHVISDPFFKRLLDKKLFSRTVAST